MEEIPLTQGKIALIDDEDYPSIARYRWYARKDRINKELFYAYRTVRRHPYRLTIAMHNQILGIKGVDHKNGDGLDNRRENLRSASKGQNIWNSRPYKGKQFKGTGKFRNGWQARIAINGKQIWLGCFKTEEEAAMAYDKKARELFGDYARTNF
jgi:hypothetical protein